MSKQCPERNDLVAFSQGNLRDLRRHTQIEMHLNRCPACCEQVEKQSAPFAKALRGSPIRPSTDEEDGCRIAIDRALELSIRNPGDSKASLSHLFGQSAASPVDTLTGTSLGRFQIGSLLGKGGMGVVYNATDPSSRQSVALKLMHPHRVDSKHGAIRFRREMEHVRRFSHPNVVAAYDAGMIDETLYLAMERIDGIDLADFVGERHPMDPATACEIIRQAAIGLDAIHSHGLVHRDVKPANLILTQSEDGVLVKILDLGLAYLKPGRDQEPIDSESLTSISQMMGTIDYISPEQCLDSRDVDVRSDIFSLGATLFRMLTGQSIWSVSKQTTQGQKLKAILIDPIPSIAEVRADLAGEIVEIVNTMLHRNREGRYQHPSELIDAITPLAKGHRLDESFADFETSHDPESLRETVAEIQDSQTSVAPSGSSEEALRKSGIGFQPVIAEAKPSRPIAWVAVVVSLVFIATGVVWMMIPNQGRFMAVVVTSINDAGAGSLRVAIRDTKAGGIIRFAPSMSGGKIVIDSGELKINRDLTIDASDLEAPIVINAEGSSRVFHCDYDCSVSLTNLTITSGKASSQDVVGGGIYSEADLSLTDVNIIGNSAFSNGGGIRQGDHGSLTMDRCYVQGNRAPIAAAIYVSCEKTTIRNCTITENTATNEYGGMFQVRGKANLVDATFTRNTAPMVPAIGISMGGSAKFQNVTITNNSSPTIAPSYAVQVFYGSTLELEDCMITGNGVNPGNGGAGSYDIKLIAADTKIITRGSNRIGRFRSDDGHVLPEEAMDDARNDGAARRVGATEFAPSADVDLRNQIPIVMPEIALVQEGHQRRLLKVFHEFIRNEGQPVTLQQSECEVIPFVTCLTYPPDGPQQKQADEHWRRIRSRYLNQPGAVLPEWLSDPRRKPLLSKVISQRPFPLRVVQGNCWTSAQYINSIELVDLRDDLATAETDESEEVAFLVISRFVSGDDRAEEFDFQRFSDLEKTAHPLINEAARPLYTPNFTAPNQRTGAKCSDAVLQHFLKFRFVEID